MHLVGTVGVTLAAVYTLRAGSKLRGLLLGGGLTIDLSTIGGIIVDDRLGSLVDGGLTLNGLGVVGVASVAGIDARIKTGTLARE